MNQTRCFFWMREQIPRLLHSRYLRCNFMPSVQKYQMLKHLQSLPRYFWLHPLSSDMISRLTDFFSFSPSNITVILSVTLVFAVYIYIPSSKLTLEIVSLICRMLQVWWSTLAREGSSHRQISWKLERPRFKAQSPLPPPVPSDSGHTAKTVNFAHPVCKTPQPLKNSDKFLTWHS